MFINYNNNISFTTDTKKDSKQSAQQGVTQKRTSFLTADVIACLAIWCCN